MEFPDLGVHCAHPACRQLDFLPFECDACGRTFCKEHRTYDSHACEASGRRSLQVPVCPLCHEPVPVGPRDNADAVMSSHIDRGCPKRPKTRSNPCSFRGCAGGELVPVYCKYCGRNYCLKHRSEVDHACPRAPGGAVMGREQKRALKKVQKQQAKAKKQSAKQEKEAARRREKDETREHTSASASGGGGDTPTSKEEWKAARREREKAAGRAKYAFGNSKRHPEGSPAIPADKRVQVRVFFTEDIASPRGEGLYMFFHRDWKLGRVLDLTAKNARIANVNNVSTAREDEKLRLFTLTTTPPQLLDLSTRLRDVPHLAAANTALVLTHRTSIAGKFIDSSGNRAKAPGESSCAVM